ncbi:MAG: UDP-N-acetylmuramate dehydrogenase [Desulfatibacillum sp.]|nr:UDP-N-acetylmuramate dehydrogenase [Desulfatibacillum sp.]
MTRASGQSRGLSPTDRDWLSRRFDKNTFFDEPLDKFTSLGVGGPAMVLLQVSDLAGLRDIIQWTGERDFPYFLLGKGTNLIVRDGGIQGIVIRLMGEFRSIEAHKDGTGHTSIQAGAGAMLARLCSFAVKNGLDGLSFATGIPGTVGGAIVMNAGTREGCVADAIQEVRIMNTHGKDMSLTSREISWSYRTMTHNLPSEPGRAAIITGGRFLTRPGNPEILQNKANEHLQRRKATQPHGVRSAGSFFKNPPEGMSAGELIDKAGLKGKAIGGAMVSPVHGNWIVNTGKATASQILSLMDLIRQEVLNMHGISLEPEVKIVGT